MGHEYGDYSHRNTDLTNWLTPQTDSEPVAQNPEDHRKKINIFAPQEAGAAYLGAATNIWDASKTV